MHAPLRRFFERLSNSSNNGAELPYNHNKRSHDNKKEIVTDGRLGELDEQITRQFHSQMHRTEKEKPKLA